MGHYDDMWEDRYCSCGSLLFRGVCSPCSAKRRLERKALWVKADEILKEHGMRLSAFAASF